MREDDYRLKLFEWLLYFHGEYKSDKREDKRLLKEFEQFEQSLPDFVCDRTLANPLINWIHTKYGLRNADPRTQAIAELQTKTDAHDHAFKDQKKINTDFQNQLDVMQSDLNRLQSLPTPALPALLRGVEPAAPKVGIFQSSETGSTHLSAL